MIKSHNILTLTLGFAVPTDWPCLHTLIATGHKQIRVPSESIHN
jgi:hypothetical protein